MTQLRMAGFRSGLVPVAAGVLLAVGLAACGSSGSSTSAAGTGGGTAAAGGQCSNIPAGPIKISNIVPLSGPTATSGVPEQLESAVVVNYFNAHDSVCGHKFAVANYNDKGDPATSLGIARQLVGQGNPIFLATPSPRRKTRSSRTSCSSTCWWSTGTAPTRCSTRRRTRPPSAPARRTRSTPS